MSYKYVRVMWFNVLVEVSLMFWHVLMISIVYHHRLHEVVEMNAWNQITKMCTFEREAFNSNRIKSIRDSSCRLPLLSIDRLTCDIFNLNLWNFSRINKWLICMIIINTLTNIKGLLFETYQLPFHHKLININDVLRGCIIKSSF